jgi:hypothetical protein
VERAPPARSAAPSSGAPECCEFEPHALTLSADLFRAYRHWCASRGAIAAGWRVFAPGLRAYNLLPARGSKGVRWWRGVRLKTDL